MNETHGKDMKSPKALPRTLDEIWGQRMSQYPTNEENVYVASLKKMNKADLQNECLRIHEVPHDERARMEDKLLKQFRRYTNAARQSVDAVPTPLPTGDASERARRALADLLNSPMGL